MPNPHPVTAGNVNWRLAMLKAQFNKGQTNRRRCIATKRDGTPCGMLAMTRYGLSVCGAHGGYAAVARMKVAESDAPTSPKSQGLVGSICELERMGEGGATTKLGEVAERTQVARLIHVSDDDR